MSTLDVEALLDATAKDSAEKKTRSVNGDSARDEKPERRDRERERDRDRDRDGSRPRDRDRDHDRRRRDRRDSPTRSRRGTPDLGTPRSDAGSHKSRRRSRSRDDDRRRSRRNRDGDYYRGGRARSRSRSRSPHRHYRPREDREHRDRRDRSDRGPRDYGRARDDDRRDSKREATPQLTEDERDRRTVFVQQLAARLRTRELKEFFEKVGPVNEAQIVKDRISQRSKG